MMSIQIWLCNFFLFLHIAIDVGVSKKVFWSIVIFPRTSLEVQSSSISLTVFDPWLIAFILWRCVSVNVSLWFQWLFLKSITNPIAVWKKFFKNWMMSLVQWFSFPFFVCIFKAFNYSCRISETWGIPQWKREDEFLTQESSHQVLVWHVTVVGLDRLHSWMKA